MYIEMNASSAKCVTCGQRIIPRKLPTINVEELKRKQAELDAEVMRVMAEANNTMDKIRNVLRE